MFFRIQAEVKVNFLNRGSYIVNVIFLFLNNPTFVVKGIIFSERGSPETSSLRRKRLETG